MGTDGQKYNHLYKEWEMLNYNKWAGLKEHLEFGIIEALLWDIQKVQYISTTESEYISFPGEDTKSAIKIIDSAKKAKETTKLFAISKRNMNEGFREYIGRIADEFEKFSDKNNLIPDPIDNSQQNGYIAADKFVEISMRNRTYEENKAK